MAKILYVDDEQILRDVYNEEFRNQGYEVASASNGVEALKVVQEFHPDLILMDVKMPQMDGLTTLEKLKKDDATKHIPVIMLSNQSEEKPDVEAAIKMGAVSYLVKANVTLKEILDKVREVLGGYVKEETKMF